jgi:hypothetical protein
MPSSVLPASWVQVLEQIQRSLEEVIRLAIEREQTVLARSPGAPVVDPEALWRPFQQRGDERWTRLQARAGQVEQTAAEVDAVLAAGAGQVNQWLSAARSLRGKLADWNPLRW